MCITSTHNHVHVKIIIRHVQCVPTCTKYSMDVHVLYTLYIYCTLYVHTCTCIQCNTHVNNNIIMTTTCTCITECELHNTHADTCTWTYTYMYMYTCMYISCSGTVHVRLYMYITRSTCTTVLYLCIKLPCYVCWQELVSLSLLYSKIVRYLVKWDLRGLETLRPLRNTLASLGCRIAMASGF